VQNRSVISRYINSNYGKTPRLIRAMTMSFFTARHGVLDAVSGAPEIGVEIC
jgi:hypothetical protein